LNSDHSGTIFYSSLRGFDPGVLCVSLRFCEKSPSPQLDFRLQEGSRKEAKKRKERQGHPTCKFHKKPTLRIFYFQMSQQGELIGC
jgi:hypothetical protein